MTDTPKLNLRQKLTEVYKRVDHVEKAGNNTKQNYKFVRAADVLRAIRDAFAELGVYAETNYDLLGTYDIKTNSGGIMHTATVKATLKLYDTDSDETKTISGLGDGADGGDKGIYKAQTGATKNALRNGSLLPDEADPEADTRVDEYTDYRGTEAMPDFQDARHAAPRAPAASTAKAEAPKPPRGPEPPAAAPKEQLPPPPVPAEKQNRGPAAAPEYGDAYEGPDNPPTEPTTVALPTEAQMADYRKRYKDLADRLAADGKLSASKGLKINTKLRVFLQQTEKVNSPNDLTVEQWEDFFSRADAVIASEYGLVGLTKLINKANGIEPKK